MEVGEDAAGVVDAGVVEAAGVVDAVVVGAAGVVVAGVVVDATGVVVAGVVVDADTEVPLAALAGDAVSVRVTWKLTGNGHPLPPLPLDPVAEEVVSVTAETPETRCSWTIVWATPDCELAQPASATLDAAADVIVAAAAVAWGAVAVSELNAASAGISPLICASSCDQGKRPDTSWRTSVSCAVRWLAAVTYVV